MLEVNWPPELKEDTGDDDATTALLAKGERERLWMPIDGVADWRNVGGPDMCSEEPFSETLWYVVSSVAEAASRLLEILGSRATAESKDG